MARLATSSLLHFQDKTNHVYKHNAKQEGYDNQYKSIIRVSDMGRRCTQSW